jgi:hypothetical protein
MTTKIEVLYPTRTERHRGIEWTPCPPGCPCTGVLAIVGGRKSTRYALTEFPAAGGRAVRLTKPGGAESYDVFLSSDRKSGTCTCAGFTYEATRKADRRHGDRYRTLGCKHLDALDALVENGWLPHPGANPDADAGPTEAPELADDYAARLAARYRAAEERYAELRKPSDPCPF